ncbi:zeta toxin family protein [Legionella oakridgensis]|uniref:Zeta toxin n=2 Tax=Legionella oakridgensis TaxID=29423 RepID=W0BDV4_9GAMM|nr:zeta toxin family protein [Legionella oakridgensis]AHE66866.1 zeta toxin [Legionella oakridgensis ATCC 33761 = DSM 21215]ETO93439.1 zeta toxin [Legionella oakridgensis RV-2-2007]KTD39757.1 coiled-coil protein [Legionella oakridgensis]STY19977.1 coiled-coil protein [Legionella longbeachae]
MTKQAWEVSTVSILSSLKKQPTVDGVLVGDLKYTVLDGEHVSYHDAEELAELHQINPRLPPKEFVAFRPERLAWHETIVAVSTQIKVENEQDMYKKCMQVYGSVLDELESLDLDQKRETIKRYTTQMVNDYLRGIDISSRPEGARIAKICKQIEESGATFGTYKEHYTAKDAMITYLTDVFYTEAANKKIGELVQRTISESDTLTPLDIPAPTERLTLMVAGGQASGKGSSVTRIKRSVEEAGVEWDNVVKINTDSYKSLLLEPGTVRPELYSQLAQEEASIIHQKIQGRLMQMAQQGKAPHVFIDQVFLGKDKIEFGLLNGGKVRGIIVSTDVTDAIERSYARGLEEGTKGRYEHTQGILRCHKLMCQQIPETLAKFVGQEVSFLLVDNNVPRGEQAKDVMAINLRSGEIEIFSKVNLERFMAKAQININARSKDELYLEAAEDPSHISYLQPLLDERCTIGTIQLTSASPNSYELDYLRQHEGEGEKMTEERGTMPKI